MTKRRTSNYVEVKFARGRTYFEAQHWEEAALAFRDVAMNHADKDVGIYAVPVLPRVAQRPRQRTSIRRAPSCYDDMAADVPKFIDLFCKGGKDKQNAEQCGILNRIQRDIERLRAEELDQGGRQGGRRRGPTRCTRRPRVALPRTCGRSTARPPCEAKQPACEIARGDPLQRRQRRSRPRRLIAKSISARKILIDPRYNLHNTEAAEDVDLRDRRQLPGDRGLRRGGELVRALRARTRRGRRPPRLSRTRSCSASVSARRIRRSRTPTSSTRTTAPPSRRRRPQIAFAIGAHYIEKEDWDQARKRLSTRDEPDRQATRRVDVQIQAHAMLGRVFIEAQQRLQRERRVQQGPRPLEGSGGRREEDRGDRRRRGEKLRRLGKVLTAVGEALFFFAEQQAEGGR